MRNKDGGIAMQHAVVSRIAMNGGTGNPAR
jgi:hypothetical protein